MLCIFQHKGKGKLVSLCLHLVFFVPNYPLAFFFFFPLSLSDLKPLLLPTSSLKEKFKNPQITVNLNKYVFIFNFPNLIPPPLSHQNLILPF